MHNFAKITIASILMMSGANLALAQDAGVQVNAGAGTTVDAGAAGANVNAGVSASAATDTFGSVISSVKTSADTDLSMVKEDTSVSIILLSSLKADGDMTAQSLDEALSTNGDAATKLHANVDANAALKAKIEAAGYKVDDVVAVSTQADGTLIVYIDDRA